MNLVIGIEDIPTDFKYITDKRGSPYPSLLKNVATNLIRLTVFVSGAAFSQPAKLSFSILINPFSQTCLNCFSGCTAHLKKMASCLSYQICLYLSSY
jgi:hypothetical protein